MTFSATQVEIFPISDSRDIRYLINALNSRTLVKCGYIDDLQLNESEKAALITFDKVHAATQLLREGRVKLTSQPLNVRDPTYRFWENHVTNYPHLSSTPGKSSLIVSVDRHKGKSQGLAQLYPVDQASMMPIWSPGPMKPGPVQEVSQHHSSDPVFSTAVFQEFTSQASHTGSDQSSSAKHQYQSSAGNTPIPKAQPAGSSYVQDPIFLHQCQPFVSLDLEEIGSRPEEFITKRGITVYVEEIDITKIHVNAIVTSTNSYLAHERGVSLAIKQAAGTEMQERCDKYVARHGPVHMPAVTDTAAGSLTGCSFIIHAPVRSPSQEASAEVFCRKLASTFYNCFMHADRDLCATSLAIPPISSGTHQTPLDIVILCMLAAISKFDGESDYLKEIHIVDVIQDKIDYIIHQFEASINGINLTDIEQKMSHLEKALNGANHFSPTGEVVESYLGHLNDHDKTNKREKQSSKRKFVDVMQTQNKSDLKSPSSPRRFPRHVFHSTPNSFEKILANGTSVKVYLADITSLDVDTIVNAANERLAHVEGVSHAISQAAGSGLQRESTNFVKRQGVVPVSGVISTSPYNLACKRIVHAVGPTSSGDTIKDKYQLTKTFDNCLSYVDMQGYRSVAVPPISSGVFGIPIDVVADCLVTAVSNYDSGSNRNSCLKEIHVVDIIHSNVTAMTEAFKIMDFPKPNTGSSLRPIIHPPKAVNFKDHCVVCMDGIKYPLTLDCGHRFCEACYYRNREEQGPKCPSCNKRFGMMKSSQPIDGSMKHTTNTFSLEGYANKGTIEITYSFPSGKQTIDHPHPGQRYCSTLRVAYLPNTPEGRQVLRLLRRAFTAGLTFTIGPSSTTGKEGIKWNKIPHKTSIYGGPEMHGYPDHGYLRRVREELAAQGIS